MRRSWVKLSGVVKAVTKIVTGCPTMIKVATFGILAYGDSMGLMKNI